MFVSLLAQKALNIQLKKVSPFMCFCLLFLEIHLKCIFKKTIHLFQSTDCKHACRTDTANIENNKKETARFVKLCFVKSKQRKSAAKCLCQNDKMTFSLFPVDIWCDACVRKRNIWQGDSFCLVTCQSLLSSFSFFDGNLWLSHHFKLTNCR